MTPLHSSVRNSTVEISKALIDRGADITLRDKDGKTALDLATDPKIKKLLQKAMEKRQK